MKIQLTMAMVVCTMALFGGTTAKALGDGQRVKERDEMTSNRRLEEKDNDAAFRSQDAQRQYDDEERLSEPENIDVDDARQSKRIAGMRDDDRINYMAPVRPLHRGRFGKRAVHELSARALGYINRNELIAPVHRGRFGKRQAEEVTTPTHRGRFGKREMVMGRRTRPFSRARGRFGKRSASPDFNTDYEEAMGAVNSQYADAFIGL